jgi:hypothetical protein
MKTHTLLVTVALLCAAPMIAASADFSTEASRPNELTPQERSTGWKLLFDGKTIKGWRNFKKTTFPQKGWVVEDGWLKHVAKAGGGDIITDEAFDDFELQWEWRMPAKANSGLKYFITEERSEGVGHEYQMIDDSIVNHGKGLTASFYDVLPPEKKTALKPMGEINHSRIVVKGNHVEHWLNGEKVLVYELGSDQVLQAVAKSKFKKVPDFGKKIRGHILLTDHQDEASFRNIKIRVNRE